MDDNRVRLPKHIGPPSAHEQLLLVRAVTKHHHEADLLLLYAQVLEDEGGGERLALVLQQHPLLYAQHSQLTRE